jgi:hypothetical protein
MAGLGDSAHESISSLAVSSSSTVVPPSERPSPTFDSARKQNGHQMCNEAEPHDDRDRQTFGDRTTFEKSYNDGGHEMYANMSPVSRKPINQRLAALFSKNGKLRSFRLLRQDIRNIRKRYVSDWTLSISSCSQVLCMFSLRTFCLE